MRSVLFTILQAAAVILVFDALGALGARALGFNYSLLAPGSYVLYFAAGLLAGYRVGWWAGAVVGATTGAIEAAVGWPLSALLGSAGMAELYATTSVEARLMTVLLLGMLGAVLGLAGSAMGAWIGRRAATSI